MTPRGKRWAYTPRQLLVWLAGSRQSAEYLQVLVCSATRNERAIGTRIPRSLRRFFGGRGRV